ncbi:MAG: hypothetical protein AAF773_04325 [Cyanobacteria bacterium P01_D01_bin.115]
MTNPQNLDVLDPFRTLAPECPDFDRSDEKRALTELAIREEMIEDVLRGEGSLDDLLDCLSDHQIDPDYWLDQVCQNIETVIDAGIVFAQNERGLFLPQR